MAIKAEFRDGVFLPLEPVALAEHTMVMIEIVAPEAQPPVPPGSLLDVLGTGDILWVDPSLDEIPEGFEDDMP
jgi:hypothetical protein